MNRREFVKALVGIGVLFNPVWRLLKGRPKAKEPWYTSAEPVGTVAFVDPFWGNSTNDGLSPEAPVATLQKAFKVATETQGGIIVVRLA